MKDIHVMLDLETMGTSGNSAIVAIGAVVFNRKEIVSSKYWLVSLQSCIDIGLEMDADTVIWWLGQEEEARNELLKKAKAKPIVSQLKELRTLLVAYEPEGLWGNGATFDNVIIRNAFKKADIEFPVEFWLDRCYRTMKAHYPQVKFERTGTLHNAEDDAKSQALHLIKIWKYMDALQEDYIDL